MTFLVLGGVLGGWAVATGAMLPRSIFHTTRIVPISYVAQDGSADGLEPVGLG